MNRERGVAISILGDLDISSDAWHRFHQRGDALYAGIPLRVQRFHIHFAPGLNRRQAAHHLFLSDFHGATHGAFPGAGVGQCGFNQVLSAKQQS